MNPTTSVPYVGNQDYRGYLNYLGTQGDSTAKSLLGFTGNDGKFNPNDALNASLTPLQASNANYYAQYQKLLNPNPTVTPLGSTGVAPTVYAPKLDIAAVNANARAAAENNVNPYYTKTLNDFLAQQAALKAQQEQATNTNIKNYQDTLQQTLDANALTGQRTTEDTATKMGQINTAQDQNQQDTGTSFENARLAAAKQQAANGVLGSGAGNRQTNNAIIQRNTTEGRQNDQFQLQKDVTELNKARTFEDLAISNKLAAQAESKNEAAAKFDLGNYIQNQQYAIEQQKNDLEKQRLQSIAQEQQNQAKLAFNNYLAGISDPAQRLAAAQTYGGAF